MQVRELFHFYDDLGFFTPPCAENHRALRIRITGRTAPAVRVPLQTELAPAEFAPEQSRRGDPDNSQGNDLLPVHASNITRFFRRATGLFGGFFAGIASTFPAQNANFRHGRSVDIPSYPSRDLCRLRARQPYLLWALPEYSRGGPG